MNNTTISISEYTFTEPGAHPGFRREHRIIMHDGFMWHIGHIQDEKQLEKMLEFFDARITKIEEKETTHVGKLAFYSLSKEIDNSSARYFWSEDEVLKASEGMTLKKLKGLSNGSIVDCYVGITDEKITIFRPNPNAKEVYKKMDFAEEMDFRRTHWYI